MTCDNCKQKFTYSFYIEDRLWIKVVGEEDFYKNVGIWCAHCTLEKLGGLDWELHWSEPLYKIGMNADLDFNRPNPT